MCDGSSVQNRCNTADNDEIDSAWLNSRRMPSKLRSIIQFANREDIVGLILDELQPLGGSEGKHPADETEIHAVRAVARSGAGSS